MSLPAFDRIFTRDVVNVLFPPDRTQRFFEALFGDTEEGAYTIDLVFESGNPDELKFAFHLNQRPGKCLACNLTYGLPQVFSRHPVIDVKGLVRDIGKLLNGNHVIDRWRLEATREMSRALHVIPLSIRLRPADDLQGGS